MSASAQKFGKVAVLMGGDSSERDVSLKSGAAVLAALRAGGVDAYAIESAGASLLKKIADGDYDRAFIMLHGRGGEDGTLQGALDMLGMPYTGSGVLGSAVSMDKWVTKQIWMAAGLPTPPAKLVSADDDLDAVVVEVGLPAIVKPANEGSSVGMARVTTASELVEAIAAAAKYDERVLVEAWVTGGEYTAAMLGEQALPLIRLETAHEFYDYDAKYLSNETKYHCPCGLSAEQEANFQTLSRKAFQMASASGWGRVDFMLDADGQPWLLEVNTVPGMTDHSLVPMAAKAAGIDMEALVWKILETSFDSQDAGGQS